MAVLPHVAADGVLVGLNRGVAGLVEARGKAGVDGQADLLASVP